jgi:hypothetical protein
MPATPASPGRRRLPGFPAAWAGLLLAACASLGVPDHYTFSESEFSALVAKRFPLTQRLGEVADVTVSSPQLWLIPERNRLGSRFDVSAAERFFGKALAGRITLDYALRFEPADDSVRLTQVRVQQLQFDGAAAALPLDAQRIGALLAETVLEDFPVYRLKPEQSDRLRAAGLKGGAVTVTSRGVEVTLAPR